MLQIFSCACWPSICLLWKNVSSGIRPFLIRLFVLLILSYMSSLYINPFWSHHMQTFSPIQYTVFILSMASFAGPKLLHLIRFHLFIFAFVSCLRPNQDLHKYIGVGNFSLLQGIFPTQGSNPGLPHCRQILYQLSHQGRPKTLQH